MQYTLIIGNKNYSSWSMRAWLMLRFLDMPFEEINIKLYTAASRSEVKALGCQTGLVPALKANDLVIWDSLAILEYLYESFPQLWPQERKQRAWARSFCCEIHSGLNALRNAMPVNLRGNNIKTNITAAVQQDIARVVEIWEFCAKNFDGPWLMENFSALDIFFAPVATRFKTYNVKLNATASEYRDNILQHPLVREWCDAAKDDHSTIDLFEAQDVS